VRGADIVVTATSSRDPVVFGEWLVPGMHLNAIGGNHAQRREIDIDAVGRASVIAVDSLEQSKMESGELIKAFEQEPEKWSQVVELADICAGKAPGRFTPGDITLFKSNGLAIEDIAVAGYVYEQFSGKE
jgi:alanine dehydrogenase